MVGSADLLRRINAVTSAAAQYLMAVSSGMQSAASSDGGSSWASANLPAGNGTWSVSATDGSGRVVMVEPGTVNCVVSTDYGATWTYVELPASPTWKAMAYGAGVFALIADSSTTMYTSSDGITWIAHTTAVPYGTWRRAVFFNSSFVAVGASGIAYTSADGISWTQITTLPRTTDLSSVAWNGAYWVITLNLDTSCFVSTDLSSWTEHSMPYQEGKWAIVGSDGSRIVSMINGFPLGAYSDDNGTTWTKITLPLTLNAIGAICYNGTAWVVVGKASQDCITSTNGATWTLHSNVLPTSTNWNALAWNGSVFIATSSSSVNYCATSTDGVTWTQQTLPETTTWGQVAWNGSVFCLLKLASSTTCYTSATGATGTWTAQTMPGSATTWAYLSWNGTAFCAITNAAGTRAATSVDGASWSSQTLSGSITPVGIVWDGTDFIVSDSSGATLISAAGSSWASGTSVGQAVAAICAHGSRVIAVYVNSYIARVTANHASTWSNSGELPGPSYWSDIVAGGYLFMAIALGTTATTASAQWVATSTDGTTWTRVAAQAAHKWQQILWDGTYFTILYNASTISYKSTNGASWSAMATLPAVHSVSGNLWLGNKYLMSPSSGYSAYYSSDGSSWTTSSDIPRPSLWLACTRNGQKVVAFVNAASMAYCAYSTNNGMTWTRATLLTPAQINCVAFGAGLFVAPVYGSSIGCTSPNGVTWTFNGSAMPNNSNWRSIAFNGSLFVAVSSGIDTATSTDGLTWSSGGSVSNSNWSNLAWNGTTFCTVSSSTTSTCRTSTNGASWASQNLVTNHSYAGLAAKTGLFVGVIGTSTSTYSTSPDGATWTDRTFTGSVTKAWAGIVYDGTDFIAIATDGTCLKSSDPTDHLSWSAITAPPVLKPTTATWSNIC